MSRGDAWTEAEGEALRGMASLGITMVDAAHRLHRDPSTVVRHASQLGLTWTRPARAAASPPERAVNPYAWTDADDQWLYRPGGCRMDPRDGCERNGSAWPDGLAALEDAWHPVAAWQQVSEGSPGRASNVNGWFWLPQSLSAWRGAPSDAANGRERRPKLGVVARDLALRVDDNWVVVGQLFADIRSERHGGLKALSTGIGEVEPEHLNAINALFGSGTRARWRSYIDGQLMDFDAFVTQIRLRSDGSADITLTATGPPSPA